MGSPPEDYLGVMDSDRPETAGPTAAPPGAAALPGADDAERSGPAPAATTEVVSPAARLDALNFAVEKSLRYHQRRRAHFDWCHRAMMFLVLVAGSGATADFFGAAKILAFLTAVLGALDLVWGPSTRARDHEVLFRRFTDLAVEIRRLATPTDADVRRLVERRLTIEADEPPIYWALEASCYNEVAAAWGRERHGLYRLGRWETVLMQVWRFEGRVLPYSGVPLHGKLGSS